jgi:endonuclease/exonuclease/phosphatase family metal-dependent hydrolase
MQNLWGVVFAFFIASIAVGEELKVATWNLEWFPSGSSRGIASPEFEADRVRSVAEVLKLLNADILVLQEMRDAKACEALVDALKPLVYHVAVCSNFKEGFGGVIGLQQVAILSKQQADSAWFENWKTFGAADPPRGFAFAVFPIGKCVVGVYGVHLKSNLTRGNSERERQLNILKRELAAEQILSHISANPSLVSKEPVIVVVAGDFNTTADQTYFASEKTLQFFQQSGFATGFENLSLPRRVTIPGKDKYPDATFDYIFVKPASIVGVPIITTSKVSDHYPVLTKIRLP